jgi:DNA-binding transcriptional LysR family regulator
MQHGNLKLFKDIALTRSISKGAAMSGLSQSAASQQIQELERVLQVMLLDRTTRPLEVTPAGLAYSHYCADILRRDKELEEELRRLSEHREGAVRVASIYSVGLSELIQLERRFLQQHPHAEVAVTYRQPQRVYVAVRNNEADLGLVSYPEPARDLTVIPWRREEMVLTAAPEHPLARRAATLQGPLPVSELGGIEFIGLDEELPLRQHVDQFFREVGVNVEVTLQFDNIEMVKEAVAQKVGVSILPHRVLRDDLRQKRLTAIRLAGATLYRPLAIIHRKKLQMNPALTAFLTMLREPAAE